MRMHKLMVVAVAVLMGCGAARFKDTHPVSVPAPTEAFSKATRVLIERGESIDTKDEAAGVIVTKWNEGNLMGDDKIRQRWTVTVASGRDGQLAMPAADPRGRSHEWRRRLEGLQRPAAWRSARKGERHR